MGRGWIGRGRTAKNTVGCRGTVAVIVQLETQGVILGAWTDWMGLGHREGSRWVLLAEGWWNLGWGRTREDDEFCSVVNGTVSRGQQGTAGGAEVRSGLGQTRDPSASVEMEPVESSPCGR